MHEYCVRFLLHFFTVFYLYYSNLIIKLLEIEQVNKKMFNNLNIQNIQEILKKFGFDSQTRAVHITFSNTELNSSVMIKRINGSHAINRGLTAELIVFSADPYIPLKEFIGAQVAVDQVTDKGQLFRNSGIITNAVQGQSDGSLSVYMLTMQDATSLWHKRSNSRVFMDKTAVEIVGTIFQEWRDKSPLFASSLKLDQSGLKKQYDIRPFSMQSNETDFSYISRILREEGINFLIDEEQYLIQNSNSGIKPQVLRLIDDNSEFKALERRTIKYHRSDATEREDTINSLIGVRSLQSSATFVHRWQQNALYVEQGSGSLLSNHQQSNRQENASLGLEQAFTISPAWTRDLKNEDQASTSSNSQVERISKQLNDFQSLQAKYFKVSGTARDTQVGYWFVINEHPELDRNHSGSEKEFLILEKAYYNENNLPKDINDHLSKLLVLNNWDTVKDNIDERIGVELTIIRKNITLVPEYSPLTDRPTAHVQRAKVVGQGDEVYTDEWGRIKVRFLFTREEDHQHDGGAGSNENDTDSAWVDVLTPWAGEGYGARFLPRIDEIVVIDFFDGNVDRPFVTGRIHEAQRSPTRFDVKGMLPDTRRLSGIRSKEFAGEGYNQLRFDDTNGQISSQLHSSHEATQLNLGNLSHPKDKEDSEGRGEGFELRTDAYGTVRGAKGVLITTQGAKDAKGIQLERSEVVSNLKSTEGTNKAIKEAANKHQVDVPELTQQTKLVDQLENWDEASDTPILVAHSTDVLVLDSNKGIITQAQDNIDSSTPKDVQFFAGRNFLANALEKISLLAKSAGIKIKAGKGPVEIQAQDDKMTISSQEMMHVYAVNDFVKVESGKGILITAGGGFIKIENGNIDIVCPGVLSLKAGQIKTMTGSNYSSSLAAMPKMQMDYDEQYVVRNRAGKLMPDTKYKMTTSDGKVIHGVTDSEGKTEKATSLSMGEVILEILN